MSDTKFTVKPLFLRKTDAADNPDDLRCAQWVIANGSAKRRDGDE